MELLDVKMVELGDKKFYPIENMDRKEWNALLDTYLTTGKMFSSEYEALNEIQRAIIQELKKAFARLNKREIETIHHSLK